MNITSEYVRNLSAAANSTESETAHLIARARVMMVISALTTVLAIAAVVVVIGYRMSSGHAIGPGAASDTVLALPKGAHVVSTSVTATFIAVTLDVGGITEVRVFDRKTLQPVGRLHFGDEK